MLSLTASFLATIFSVTAAAAEAEEVKQEQPKPHVYGRVVALCVGIENYQHASVPPAPAAENDARAIREILKSQYGYEAETLIGPRATKKAIKERITSLAKELTPDDALIVFFSGHGQVINLGVAERAGYLLPYDADLDLNVTNQPEEWEDRAINMRSMIDLTETIEAKHVLLLIDACCSGFMTKRGTNLEFRSDLKQLLDMPSRVVVSATTEYQPATTRKAKGKDHGIFTAALLDALETEEPHSSNAKSVLDLVYEIRPKVVSASKRNMTPQTSSFAKAGKKMDGEFVFLPLTITRRQIEETLKAATKGAMANLEPNVFTDVLKRQAERVNLQTKLEDVIEAWEAIDYRYSTDLAKKASIWRQKREQYERNAANGDVLAKVALVYCYEKGLGLPKRDPGEAYRFAQLAFETGYEGGEHVLGKCLLHGIGTVKNAPAGFAMIKSAAEKRFPISLLQSGQDHWERGNTKEAFRDWNEAHAMGAISARISLAKLASNPKEAIQILLPAAEKGIPQAQSALAWKYAKEIDPPKRTEAAYWLKEAANNGLAIAQVNFAIELIAEIPAAKKLRATMGLQLEPDLTKAREWAAQAGSQPVDEESHDHLKGIGNFYYYTNEFVKAEQYFNKFDMFNHSEALQMKSGWCVTGNQMNDPDTREGLRLAWEAYKTGDSEAKLWLGALYGDGVCPGDQKIPAKGGPTALHHALHFFILAADQNDPKNAKAAAGYVRDVAKIMDADPDSEVWKAFQRIYPNDVESYRKYTQEQPAGPAPAAPAAKIEPVFPKKPLAFGVAVENAIAGVEDGGVMVTEVQEGSPAAKIGLKKGDVLLTIDGKAMKSAKDVTNAIKEADATISIIVIDGKDKSIFTKTVRLNK